MPHVRICAGGAGRPAFLPRPFAGSERGGEACAIVTSLIETAKAHGHDPLAYLTDVLERLPTTLNRDIESLLPMNWRASGV